MRKPTKRSVTRKLDTICSKIVRSVGICQRCDCDQYEKLHCCHIYTRKWRSVRWDLLNLICLCASCHAHFHDAPIKFGEFVNSYLGDAKYVELKIRANALKKWTLDEMLELLESLETQFANQWRDE